MICANCGHAKLSGERMDNLPPEAFLDPEYRYTDCERCDGTGTMKLTGFISYSDGRHEAANQKPMQCTECYGRGSISGLTRKMRRIAEHIRRGRIELDVTQTEQAKIVGMPFSEWNAILRGRINAKEKA